MKPGKESKLWRITPGRVQGGGQRRGRVLSDLFNETAAEKDATRFDRFRGIDVHGITLAVTEDEKRVRIYEKAPALNDPVDFTAHDGLDRKRAGKFVDYVSPARRVKHEIVLAKA